MTPSELHELLLYGTSTEENHKKLPADAFVIWLGRPTRASIDSGRVTMYIRATLIAAMTIYLYYFHRDIGEASMLPPVIATYEAAYYMVRKEKNELEYSIARKDYVRQVKKYMQKQYPNWEPES